MSWFAWLALAVLITAVAAITGIKPKGTRHVASTRLMGMARLFLLVVVIIFAYLAFRARSGSSIDYSVFSASVAACAVCFSLRAALRVCHDLPSVLGFGFSFFLDSRADGVVVVFAMYPQCSRPDRRAVC